METNQLYLFKDRRFLPIFLVQLFGCLNDSILKNALIILITYKISHELSSSIYFLIMLANVIFILPFVVFASIAGQVADKYERSSIVKIIKFAELAIVLIAAYGFYHNNLLILFLSIGLMGTHSSFFGPIKYSVLPDHMKKYELLGANGFIEAGTFLSILFGTILGNLYNFNAALIVALSIIIAIFGLVASFYMPKSNNSNSNIQINFNIIEETKSMIKYASSKNYIYLAILGISWFWFIGAAIMAQIPSLARNILGSDENVANLFLAVFSIGVGTGSALCNKILSNKVSTRYVFITSLGISIFGIDLYLASNIASVNYEPETLRTVWQFLSKGSCWRILLDLFLLAAIGGLYVVPLFAVMQYFTAGPYRSRVIATNNLINAFFMAGSTILLSALYFIGLSIPLIILTISLLNLVITAYIYHLIPNSRIMSFELWRRLFKLVFNFFYNIEVKGLENYNKASNKTVVVANHLSYLDPALIAAYLPGDIKFAINSAISKEWWVRPFLKVVKTYPLDKNNPMAIKSLIDEVKQNKKIAIFPEGRTTTTGSLMKIYEGPGMIADKAEATLLPIRVNGTQFTIFSKIQKLMGVKRFSFRRKISISILPPVKFTPKPELCSKERRKFIAHALYDVMSEMIFESSDYKKTIIHSLIESSKIYGNKLTILDDIENNSAKYPTILLKTFIVANLAKKYAKNHNNIGLMLPNMSGSLIAFLGLQAAGYTPAMINFTSGAKNIIASCRNANVQTIFTSKKFIEKASLVNLVESLESSGINVFFMDDMKKDLTLFIKLKCLVASFFPETYYNTICLNQDPESTAVILFTSGSEGLPKAVALSHNNIQANRCQILARIDFTPYDCAFNALPMFHAFGLTSALVMCLSGVRTFFYPSPLHYRIIPEVIYDIGATIMFSTDTFLSGYSNYAHPYDFYSLRYVIAGAEKVRQKTRETWFQKFGIRIFEGYGVTEASPVLAFNTPMYNKYGSVGRLLPNIEYFLQTVDGIKEGGRLCIKGPNIMQGYMLENNPGVIAGTSVDNLGVGWYDTGDIVSIDESGFITIIGREKRFAKIGGEMISLSIVEELLSKTDDQHNHAVIYLSDEKKGEKLIAFTNNNSLSLKDISLTAKEMELSKLYIPKTIVYIKEIPLLASGKVDYKLLPSLYCRLH